MEYPLGILRNMWPTSPEYASTNEPGPIRLALRPLRRLYIYLGEIWSMMLVRETFEFRDEMIRADSCRNVVNSHIGRIRSLFKWAVEPNSRDLKPLQSVRGLARFSKRTE